MDKNKKSSVFADRSFREGIVFRALSLGLIVYAWVGHSSGMKYDWKMSPYLFPILAGVFLLISSAALLVRAVRGGRARARRGETSAFNARRFLAALALVLAYVGALHFVPFAAATPVFLALMLLLLGERRPWVCLAVPLLMTGLVFLLFGMGLHVDLP